MQPIFSRFRRLSRAQQLVLGGSAATTLAVFMPWHTTGILEQQVFAGLGGSNLLLGGVVLFLGLTGLLFFGLPLLGVRLPRLPWPASRLATLLGLECATLLLAVMLVRLGEFEAALNYGLEVGLVGALFTLWGGRMLAREEEILSVGLAQEPLARPRRHHAEPEAEAETTEPTEAVSQADRRMRLDI